MARRVAVDEAATPTGRALRDLVVRMAKVGSCMRICTHVCTPVCTRMGIFIPVGAHTLMYARMRTRWDLCMSNGRRRTACCSAALARTRSCYRCAIVAICNPVFAPLLMHTIPECAQVMGSDALLPDADLPLVWLTVFALECASRIRTLTLSHPRAPGVRHATARQVWCDHGVRAVGDAASEPRETPGPLRAAGVRARAWRYTPPRPSLDTWSPVHALHWPDASPNAVAPELRAAAAAGGEDRACRAGQGLVRRDRGRRGAGQDAGEQSACGRYIQCTLPPEACVPNAFWRYGILEFIPFAL